MGRAGFWAADQRKVSSEKGTQRQEYFNFNESKGRLLVQGNRIKTVNKAII